MHRARPLPPLQRLCLVLLLALALWGFTGCGGPGRPFLWKIEKDGKTLYLFGTIHTGQKDMYPMHAATEDALKRSDHLGVEIDIGSIQRREEIGTKAGQLAQKPFGEKENIPQHLMDKLEALYKQRGLEDWLLKFRFYYLVQWIAGANSNNQPSDGISPEHGVDLYLLNEARKARKTIVELEQVELQVQLFYKLSLAHPEVFFDYHMSESQSGVTIADLLGLYRSGDQDAVTEMLFAPLRKEPRFLPIYEKLFFERNVQMVAKIESYLKASGSYFVAVGAGHYLGDKGIVALLHQKGYDVQPVP